MEEEQTSGDKLDDRREVGETKPTKGDVYLIIAGVLLAMFILARLTTPEHYGMTLHPKYDRLWMLQRVATTAGWMFIGAAMTVVRPPPSSFKGLLAASATTIVATVLLASTFPQDSRLPALIGSILIYAATSGVLCVRLRKTAVIVSASVVLFVLQLLVDGFVGMYLGIFRIH